MKHGEYYHYTKNSGLQNHNVVYRKQGENGTEEIFLDPNSILCRRNYSTRWNILHHRWSRWWRYSSGKAAPIGERVLY